MDKLDIRPFKIHIPDIDVADLSERIKRTRLPDEYQNSNWDTGTDKIYLKALLEYWASGYDRRAQEAKLNCLTQFVARIGNNDIHFVHARSQVPGALPIIITHGWPGSFVEIIELIPMLTDPARFGGNPNEPSMSSCRRCPASAFHRGQHSLAHHLPRLQTSGRS